MENGVSAMCSLRADHCWHVFSRESQRHAIFLFLFLKMSSFTGEVWKKQSYRKTKHGEDQSGKQKGRGSLGEQTEGNSFGSWWWFLEHSQISAVQPPIVGFCCRSENQQRSRFEVGRGLVCLSFLSEGGRCTSHCIRIESTHSYCDCVCLCGSGVARSSVSKCVQTTETRTKTDPGLLQSNKRVAGIWWSQQHILGFVFLYVIFLLFKLKVEPISTTTTLRASLCINQRASNLPYSWFQDPEDSGV